MSTDPVEVPVETAGFHRGAHAGGKHEIMFGPQLAGKRALSGLPIAVFDQDPYTELSKALTSPYDRRGGGI